MVEKKKYSIIDYPKKNETYGVYISSSPKQAASKAFTQLARMSGIKNTNKKNAIVFTIKNMDNDKLYKYTGVRVELKQPIIKKIKDKEIVYRYKNIITRLK